MGSPEGPRRDFDPASKIEARLRDSETRFRRIVEGSDAGYFRLGLDGRFEDVNASWLRLHGMSAKEEIIGRHYAAVEVPEDLEKADGVVDAILRGTGSVAGEFSRRSVDGSVGYHTYSASPVVEEGRVVGIEGFLIDTTARRRAEEARRRTEERYSALFDCMSEGVALHRLISADDGTPLDYVLLDVNRRYEEMAGKKLAEVVGRPATEVYGTPSAPYLSEYAAVVATGRPLFFETFFAPMNKHFVISAAPMGDGLFATIFFDVTARKRAEEELTKRDAQLKRAHRIASMGTWRIDFRTGFLDWGNEVFEIFGLGGERQLTRELFLALVHPDDQARVRAAGEVTRSTGAPFAIDHRIVLPGGAERWVQERAEVVRDDAGNIVGMEGTVQDITEYRRLEEQFHQSQKLESVGRLAGGVAHDFNNLLTVINGYNEMIVSQLRPGDPLLEYAQEIRQAGARAADLTRQLLAFSRKQVFHPSPLDMNRLLAESENMLRRLIGEDIALETSYAPGLGLIEADPNQLHQVLLNLMVNAKDAMPEGGRIVMQTAMVQVEENDSAGPPGTVPGSYILLSISDTGMGMDSQTQARIFEPFFTTKPIGTGTGLGLATVYGIVKQSGGSIRVSSEPGRGTTFDIYFPPAGGVAAPQDAPSAPVSLRGSETVLVVEDQREVRNLAGEMLKRLGYRVLLAASGEDALLLAARHQGPIQLAVTDVVMPGMSGKEMAERLVQESPATKVLYISGYSDSAIARQGILEPGIAYLAKPFTAEALAAKVREVLGPPLSRSTILVVDDEPGVRTFFREILAGEGYTVVEAVNGLQAERVLAGRDADLVLMDLVMPDREGIETIQVLRKERPNLKIIAVSGAFGGAYLEIARKLGADATLAKPVSPENLLSAVRKVLG